MEKDGGESGDSKRKEGGRKGREGVRVKHGMDMESKYTDEGGEGMEMGKTGTRMR